MLQTNTETEIVMSSPATSMYTLYTHKHSWPYYNT